jgi:chromosome segregation ATPase
MRSRRSNKQEEDNQSESSVWTSYSDMFTTIAIIFLVMFVFALIKAGVSSMKVAQQNIEHKEMLEGKIPVKLANENLKQKKEIDKSIKEMDQYNEMISEKVKELNSFSKKMIKHKRVMASLLKDQEIKTVAMDNMRVVIDDKKKVIRKVQSKIKGLAKTIIEKEEVIKKKNLENIKISSAKLIVENEIKNLQNNIIKTEQELKKRKKHDIINHENSIVKEKTIRNLQQKISKLDNVVITKKDIIKNLEDVHQTNKVLIKNQNTLIKETSIKLKNSEMKSDKLISKTSELQNKIKKKLTRNKTLEKTIYDLGKVISDLETKESNSLKRVSNLNSNNKSLSQKNSTLNSDMKALKTDLLTAQSSNSKLQKDLTFEKGHSQGLESKINSLAPKISRLGIELKSYKGDNLGKSKEIGKLKGSLVMSISANQDLQSRIVGFKQEVDGLKGELKGSGTSNIELKSKLTGLAENLRKTEGILKSTLGEKAGLKGLLGKVKGSLKVFQGDIWKLKVHLSKEKKETKRVKQKVLQLKEKISMLEKSLTKSNGKYLTIKGENFKNLKSLKKLETGIAHVGKELRSTIAENIADKLKKNNINVEVNKETGSIILRMDDTFLFKRNDYRLSEKAKDSLQKIIPIYTEELFKDPAVREYISQVHIIGHASPRYMKNFVSPDDMNNFTAYQFNMDLSTNRAKEIVKYIFSEGFGDFPFRQEFRRKISSVGKSFSNPINAGRGVAAQSYGNKCGRYDCRLSRRVEVSFTLNENANLYKKIKSLHVAK